jgi:hypothetical protein
MRDLLDDGFVGTITTADGGARQVTADDYVDAARGGRTLHDFSGQLGRAADGKLVSLTMVDAKPAESDRFWAS